MGRPYTKINQIKKVCANKTTRRPLFCEVISSVVLELTRRDNYFHIT